MSFHCFPSSITFFDELLFPCMSYHDPSCPVMLIEEMGSIPAFSLTSCDFSDKMLKHALKTRWDRRREQAFFDWTIEVGSCLYLFFCTSPTPYPAPPTHVVCFTLLLNSNQVLRPSIFCSCSWS